MALRLDKWLWAARFFKTRSLSQEAIELGRVKVAGVRVKSSKEIHIGDTVEIYRGQEHYVVLVKELSTKRGGAPEAQKLYEETLESRQNRERIRENSRMAPMPGSDHHGRPTKREGRLIRQLISGFDSSKEI